MRLNGGAVSVKDRGGQTLLDVTGTQGLLTAQLAMIDGTPGLSLATGDGKVPAGLPRLSFDKGNVAFADVTGNLMAFDTVRDRAVRVVVADDAGWADWLDRFRVVLVLGAWGLVTLVGVGALRFARGEYLVIFDAEDQPEPDQLKKVVVAFRKASPNTACIQCRLNYFNANENWLTRMFTLDYSLWFDFMLGGGPAPLLVNVLMLSIAASLWVRMLGQGGPVCAGADHGGAAVLRTFSVVDGRGGHP